MKKAYIVIVIIVVSVVIGTILIFSFTNSNEQIKNNGTTNTIIMPSESFSEIEKPERKEIYFTKDIDMTNIEEIEKTIKGEYSFFSTEYYKLRESTSMAINTETGEEKGTKYLEFKLKLGDFDTLSGINVKCNNGKVEKIFDNIIDVKKEEKLISDLKNKKIDMKANLSRKDIEDLKNTIVKKYDFINYENIIEEIYFYDIKENKKYIKFNIESNSGLGQAIFTEEFEIK